MQTVVLSSSDGRYEVSVPVDDADMIAAVLLLLELPATEPTKLVDITERGHLRADGFVHALAAVELQEHARAS
jgi:hypothetical protein